MLRAIRYCHLNGVVHRDIKLDNFIYEAPGDDAELKLIDFGFACEVRIPALRTLGGPKPAPAGWVTQLIGRSFPA